MHAFWEAISQNYSKQELNQAEERMYGKLLTSVNGLRCFLQCYSHEKKTGLDKNNTQRKNPTAEFTREVKKHEVLYTKPLCEGGKGKR